MNYPDHVAIVMAFKSHTGNVWYEECALIESIHPVTCAFINRNSAHIS